MGDSRFYIHLDVPWLPSWIEQREGRIERQGNENPEIEIFAYATQGSVDSQMWQTNERKSRFIALAMAGDRGIRRVEDVGAQANQFAIAKALASGDPRLIQKAGLDADVARLQRLLAAHNDEQFSIRREIVAHKGTIEDVTNMLAGFDSDFKVLRQTRGNLFEMIVDGRVFKERKLAGNALALGLNRCAKEKFEDKQLIGKLGGFDLLAKVSRGYASGKMKFEVVIDFAYGRAYVEMPDPWTSVGAISRLESQIERIHKDREKAESRLQYAIRELKAYSSRTGLAFEFKDELDDKFKCLAAINAELISDADASDEIERKSKEKELEADDVAA